MATIEIEEEIKLHFLGYQIELGMLYNAFTRQLDRNSNVFKTGVVRKIESVEDISEAQVEVPPVPNSHP